MPSMTIPDCQHTYAGCKIGSDHKIVDDVWTCDDCGVDLVPKDPRGITPGWNPVVPQIKGLPAEKTVPVALRQCFATKGNEAWVADGTCWRYDGSAWHCVGATVKPKPSERGYSISDSPLTTPGVPIDSFKVDASGYTMSSAGRIMLTSGSEYGQVSEPCAAPVPWAEYEDLLIKYKEANARASRLSDVCGDLQEKVRQLSIENSDLGRENDRLRRRR